MEAVRKGRPISGVPDFSFSEKDAFQIHVIEGFSIQDVIIKGEWDLIPEMMDAIHRSQS